VTTAAAMTTNKNHPGTQLLKHYKAPPKLNTHLQEQDFPNSY